jgi:hypothetical protein
MILSKDSTRALIADATESPFTTYMGKPKFSYVVTSFSKMATLSGDIGVLPSQKIKQCIGSSIDSLSQNQILVPQRAIFVDGVPATGKAFVFEQVSNPDNFDICQRSEHVMKSHNPHIGIVS